MKSLKFLVAVFGVSLFVGCGGGGSSGDGNTGGGGSNSSITDPIVPVLDNSVLSDGENSYGYYGEEVVYGNVLAAGSWVYMGNTSDIDFDLLADGTMLLNFTTGTIPFSYGISQNGKDLSYGPGEAWRITGEYTNGVDKCYDIDVFEYPILPDARKITTASICKK